MAPSSRGGEEFRGRQCGAVKVGIAVVGREKYRMRPGRMARPCMKCPQNNNPAISACAPGQQCLSFPAMEWDIDKTREQYNIAGWSSGYFDVGEGGHLVARPAGVPGGAGVDLYELAHRAREAGLSWPVLARFTDILHQQVDRQCGAFGQAMKECGYEGRYTAVYPIKVNQQQHVVDAIVRHGGDRVGLEAGSKPELMAVIGISNPGGIIVCNGYKDAEYIRLALIAQRLGQQVTIVIEKLSELELVKAAAAAMNIRPRLGVRLRLSAETSGKWQNTGGERSKFGLTAAGL
ncbi:MAG TPA: hypothetical protein VET88_05460, partial [Gammaproteobacteria bacterium]|nr:hypothetical protein [Gammaproteobacteria bacterium]